MSLVKDEQHFDRFDLAFGSYFKGIDAIFDIRARHSRGVAEARSSCARCPTRTGGAIEALGGLDKLMETFKQRLAEQRERHAGGSKWIGTGGTSPFGAYGYNPEGIRIGQDEGGASSAVKVWDERDFATSTATSSSIRATSRSRCGGCAASRARACPRSSTSTARSRARRATPAGST